VAGVGLTELVRGMVDALDVDRQYAVATAEADGSESRSSERVPANRCSVRR